MLNIVLNFLSVLIPKIVNQSKFKRSKVIKGKRKFLVLKMTKSIYGLLCIILLIILLEQNVSGFVFLLPIPNMFLLKFFRYHKQ